MQVVEGIPALGLEECFWVWAPVVVDLPGPMLPLGGKRESPSFGDKECVLASCCWSLPLWQGGGLRPSGKENPFSGLLELAELCFDIPVDTSG